MQNTCSCPSEHSCKHVHNPLSHLCLFLFLLMNFRRSIRNRVGTVSGVWRRNKISSDTHWKTLVRSVHLRSAVIRPYQSVREMTDLPRGSRDTHSGTLVMQTATSTACFGSCDPVFWDKHRLRRADDVSIVCEPWEALKLWCGVSVTHCHNVKIAESDNWQRVVELLRDEFQLLDIFWKDTNHGSRRTWPHWR